jgi:hypothetical protein
MHTRQGVAEPAQPHHNPKRHAEAQQRICGVFNAVNPVGTVCRYWTGAREGAGKLAPTRTQAQMLSGHTAVVWFEGEAGCVSLSHVEAVRP